MKLPVFILALMTMINLPLSEASVLPRAMDNYITKEATRIAGSTPKLRPVREGCADFSGHWEGTCRIGEESIQAKLTITQNGCQSINVNDENYIFGQNSAETSSFFQFFTSSFQSVKLSEDGQKALAYGTVLVDHASLREPVMGRITGNLARAGEQLELSSRVSFHLGDESKGVAEGRCQLTKMN